MFSGVFQTPFDDVDVERSSLTFAFDHSKRKRIDSDQGRYTCSWSISSDGRWCIAFGPEEHADGCRAFGIHDGTIRYSITVERPTECWIANTGDAVVVDAGSIRNTESRILFVTPETETVNEAVVSVSTNIGSAAISPNGRFGAFTTVGPEKTVHLYDLDTDDERAQFVPEDGTRHLVSFDDSGDECYLYDAQRDTLVCAIDIDGNRTWTHPRFKKTVPVFTRAVERIKKRIGA